MSKSQEFRLKVQQKDRHLFRKKRVEELKEADRKEFKEQLNEIRRNRRRDLDSQ